MSVLLPGGARRPPDPRLRAVFALLRELPVGESVVDACPACGMPRTTPDPVATAVPWPLPEVGLIWRAGVFTRDGTPVTAEEARQLVEARAPLPVESRATSALQGAMLALMVGPVLLWVFLFLFWFNYVLNLGSASWAG